MNYEFWDNVGKALLSLAMTALVLLILTICLSTKNVDYYYTSNGSSNEGVACVNAHWTWHTDEKAFCSNNKDEVLDFLTKANASLPTKK